MSSRSSSRPVLPDCEWTTDTCTPEEYVELFKGPGLVKISAPDGGVVNFGEGVDSTKPFLVYSHRRRTKVYAESVRKIGRADYQGTGSIFEVPKDYVGWFEVMPKDGRPPGHFETIASLATSGYHFFLTRTVLCGFKVKENDKDIHLLEDHTMYPGEVLKVTSVCRKTWKTKSPSIGKPPPETNFLKCRDVKENDICIPLAHPGIFSVIAEPGSQNPDVVYQIWAVLNNHPLPVIIRLVFGWAPKVSENEFSGYLKLLESKRSDSLMLFNFTETGHILLELPASADVRFQKPKDTRALDNSDAFKRSLLVCQKLVFPFAISMKPLQVAVNTIKTEGEEENTRNDIASGLMANPRNMAEFSRSDVYPPPATDFVSDTWSFSFKDPAHIYDGNHMTVESVDESDDYETLTGVTRRIRASGGRPDVRRDKTVSVTSDAGYCADDIRMHRMNRSSDARASRMKEIRQREAKC